MSSRKTILPLLAATNIGKSSAGATSAAAPMVGAAPDLAAPGGLAGLALDIAPGFSAEARKPTSMSGHPPCRRLADSASRMPRSIHEHSPGAKPDSAGRFPL